QRPTRPAPVRPQTKPAGGWTGTSESKWQMTAGTVCRCGGVGSAACRWRETPRTALRTTGPHTVTTNRGLCSISDLSLRRETVNQFDDERPVARAGQGPRIREAKPGERIGRVPRVPHQEDIVPDHRDPVEPHIEVDALVLVVVLDEREQARAGIEVVLEPVR